MRIKLNKKKKIKLTSEEIKEITEEVNKIALSSNGDKRVQSIDSSETNAFGTRKSLLRWKRRD